MDGRAAHSLTQPLEQSDPNHFSIRLPPGPQSLPAAQVPPSTTAMLRQCALLLAAVALIAVAVAPAQAATAPSVCRTLGPPRGNCALRSTNRCLQPAALWPVAKCRAGRHLTHSSLCLLCCTVLHVLCCSTVLWSQLAGRVDAGLRRLAASAAVAPAAAHRAQRVAGSNVRTHAWHMQRGRVVRWGWVGGGGGGEGRSEVEGGTRQSCGRRADRFCCDRTGPLLLLLSCRRSVLFNTRRMC